MRALVADKLPESGRGSLAQHVAITYSPTLSADELPGAIGDHEILIVRSTKVPAEVFFDSRGLQLVIRAGAGTNTIDVAAASAMGVYVANCPGKNAVAVAELAIGLLIALDRRIPAANAELTAGKWNKKEYSQAEGLLGKTLGVVGVGGIGREVISRARALGMRVVGWSRSLTPEDARELGITRASSLTELAAASDAISVHLAHNADTAGCIDASFFAALPERALVINTSRGGIIDEAALLAAMNDRGVRYATDVYDGEPSGGSADFEHPVLAHPNSICTPHIGASTSQAQAAVAEEAVRIVATFIASGEVPNCVNLRANSQAVCQLSVRHLDKVGVLANVLTTIREAEINVEEVRNIMFSGTTAACATLRLSSRPSDDLIQQIADIEHVIGVQLRSG